MKKLFVLLAVFLAVAALFAISGCSAPAAVTPQQNNPSEPPPEQEHHELREGYEITEAGHGKFCYSHGTTEGMEAHTLVKANETPASASYEWETSGVRVNFGSYDLECSVCGYKKHVENREGDVDLSLSATEKETFAANVQNATYNLVSVYMENSPACAFYNLGGMWFSASQYSQGFDLYRSKQLNTLNRVLESFAGDYTVDKIGDQYLAKGKFTNAWNPYDTEFPVVDGQILFDGNFRPVLMLYNSSTSSDERFEICFWIREFNIDPETSDAERVESLTLAKAKAQNRGAEYDVSPLRDLLENRDSAMLTYWCEDAEYYLYVKSKTDYVDSQLTTVSRTYLSTNRSGNALEQTVYGYWDGNIYYYLACAPENNNAEYVSSHKEQALNRDRFFGQFSIVTDLEAILAEMRVSQNYHAFSGANDTVYWFHLANRTFAKLYVVGGRFQDLHIYRPDLSAGDGAKAEFSQNENLMCSYIFSSTDHPSAAESSVFEGLAEAWHED